jgi:hypothetical protein
MTPRVVGVCETPHDPLGGLSGKRRLRGEKRDNRESGDQPAVHEHPPQYGPNRPREMVRLHRASQETLAV